MFLQCTPVQSRHLFTLIHVHMLANLDTSWVFLTGQSINIVTSTTFPFKECGQLSVAVSARNLLFPVTHAVTSWLKTNNLILNEDTEKGCDFDSFSVYIHILYY